MRPTILLLSLLEAALPAYGAVTKHAFRLREAPGYIHAAAVAADKALRLLPQGATYVETAAALVRSTAPNTTFRVVDDHYVGRNGIGHVHFKQTVHGRDIENANFGVHVCCAPKSGSTVKMVVAVVVVMLTKRSA